MNFESFGEGTPFIFLHGWGGNLQTFEKIAHHFEDKKIYLVELPGFGKSEEPCECNIDYYAKKLHEFVKERNIKDFILLGHSFGGRVK